jgi:antitoxin CptB
VNAPARAAELQRLRWRCRRGTRELDRLLGDWLERRYTGASPALQAAFSELLDEQDPQLWDWLMGREAPQRAEFRRIVDAIRSDHGL